MIRAVGGRVLRFVLTLFATSVLVFAFMRILPGDPAEVVLGTGATEEALERTRAEFGLDRPLAEQYWDWVSGIPVGDFGVSFITGEDISPVVLDRLAVSLILVVSAMALALLVAVPLGTWAAVRHRRADGIAISAATQFGIAVPNFLAGMLLVAVFALGLGWLPANSWMPPAYDPVQFVLHLILPVVALAAVQAAVMTRYVRTAMLDVMGEDWMRTARAKGLSTFQALRRHGLRNAALPVLTVSGIQLTTLVIGAVVIEQVFVIPGIGSELLTAVAGRDLLTVQSVVMLLALITLTVNFTVDLLYLVLDPRTAVQR
ncbi:ABC transporter permease [Nocardiopsis ganjiahuensis]|uniref:ABC transporter permease n=1 Tax=Nocardiopsis ganjiahuensis TaxID=239984 RepID=UPI00034770B7|nr:ABC transporter permease [Nocardiopsis ganjiahuensis]